MTTAESLNFFILCTPPKIALNLFSNDSHTASQLKAGFSDALSSIRQYFKRSRSRDVTDNAFRHLRLEGYFYRAPRFILSYNDAPPRMPQCWGPEDPFDHNFSSRGKPLPLAEYLGLLDIHLDLSSIIALHMQMYTPPEPTSPAPLFLSQVWKILFSLPKL